MGGYVDFPFSETGEEATQRILAGLAARIPGWTPGGEGTLEVALAEEIGREVSDLRQLAVDVAASVVRTFGRSLFGVPYLQGAPAAISARVSSSVQGVTIPAGFTVTGTTVDGVLVAFELPADSKLAANASSKTVTLVARESGAFGNGVPLGPLSVATATPSITSVVAETAPSSGGADPENDEQYQNRLVSALGLFSPTPIVAEDFATLARGVPGVHRVLALDLYDPDTGSTSAERTVTVVPIDVDGYAVPDDVRADVVALLDAEREVNFVVKATVPTYQQISVAFTARALPGYDADEVLAAVIARGYAILDPAVWGGGDEEPPAWRDERVVYYLEMASELDRVEGVDRITSLTINGVAGDYAMDGIAVLPAPRGSATPSVVTGTVS